MKVYRRDNMLKDKLKEYIDAGVPIIYINSHDDNTVSKTILEITGKRKVWEWNSMEGILDKKNPDSEDNIMERPLKEFIKYGTNTNQFNRKVVIVKDIAAYLEESEMVALFKNACLKIEEGAMDTVFIFISPVIKIPKELEKYITILEEDYLSEEQIRDIIQEFIEDNRMGSIYEKLLDEMSIAFKGLSALEIQTILALAYTKYGQLTKDAMGLIIEQKKQMIQKSGILEMVPVKESMNDIGGLENLKAWISKKAKVLNNMKEAKRFGVELPKGVLIAGVPGCGKSLNAKASAKLFNVPLLKLDMGRLLGKYVGESESNMRKAIAMAEAISPCVLWIDELEKAFSGIGENGGGAEVTTRLFGQFLTWMQDKESAVFVVATANNVMKLPPELMRKGRFDEIFYVQLPNDEERKKIFEIHIGKRRPKDLEKIVIDELVKKTQGYSGADIEGVVKEAVENAFVAGKIEVSTEEILQSIQSTHSLKEIMGESITKLEKEYKERKFKSAS